MTKSGHYAIPINTLKVILNNETTGTSTNVTLSTTEKNKSKSDITLKLQRKSAYSLSDKLLRLLNSAENPVQTDKKAKKLMRFSDEFSVVLKPYCKAPPKPVVYLPMTTLFQGCVSKNLESYKLLSMIS